MLYPPRRLAWEGVEFALSRCTPACSEGIPCPLPGTLELAVGRQGARGCRGGPDGSDRTQDSSGALASRRLFRKGLARA